MTNRDWWENDELQMVKDERAQGAANTYGAVAALIERS
jgi:hypothetical protein